MAGMEGVVGPFLEAAGNVIWGGRSATVIKCPLSPSSNAAAGKTAHPAQLKIREPRQRNRVSHRLHAPLRTVRPLVALPLYSPLLGRLSISANGPGLQVKAMKGHSLLGLVVRIPEEVDLSSVVRAVELELQLMKAGLEIRRPTGDLILALPHDP